MLERRIEFEISIRGKTSINVTQLVSIVEDAKIAQEDIAKVIRVIAMSIYESGLEVKYGLWDEGEIKNLLNKYSNILQHFSDEDRNFVTREGQNSEVCFGFWIE